MGWGGAVVDVVESDPGIGGSRGGRVWHRLGPALLCPWEGMSSLPLFPCGEETVRQGKWKAQELICKSRSALEPGQEWRPGTCAER